MSQGPVQQTPDETNAQLRRGNRPKVQSGAPTPIKKKFCMYHLQGVCRFSESECSFAHSLEEIYSRGKAKKTRSPPSMASSGGGVPMGKPDNFTLMPETPKVPCPGPLSGGWFADPAQFVEVPANLHGHLAPPPGLGEIHTVRQSEEPVISPQLLALLAVSRQATPSVPMPTPGLNELARALYRI